MSFISIIIPTFNSAKTLSIALESILQQYYTDFEILIIDGLSTDNTIEIAQSYSDERIKIISEKDNGIYDAMNKGIILAQSEWLYFLGSDDSLYNRHILSQVLDVITKNNYDIIYGDVLSTKFNGRYDGEFNYMKIFSQNICHQSIFFKKCVFKKTGLFNLKYNAHADWDNNMNWFLNPSISKVYIPCVIANYADGGYSSTYGDPIFANNRILQFLLYGKKQLPFRFRIGLLKQELKRTAHRDNKYLFLRLCINAPKILVGV